MKTYRAEGRKVTLDTKSCEVSSTLFDVSAKTEKNLNKKMRRVEKKSIAVKWLNVYSS